MLAAPDPIKTNPSDFGIFEINSDGFLKEFSRLEVVNLLIIDNKALIEGDCAEKTPILFHFIL